LLVAALLLSASVQAQELGVLPQPFKFTAAPSLPPQPGEEFSAVVLKVLDADTVVVKHKGELQVRFAAVDAPEVAHPEHGKPGQPYGDEAAAFVRALVEGKRVKVKVHAVDKYGRTVGEIHLSNGKSVQEEMLREGWAWWNFFFNHDEALNKLENEAINAGRGLWAGKARGGEYHPEAPWIFRRRVDAGLRRVLPGDKASFSVKHMPDADTVALGTRQGVYDYIRLAGIDAPEVSHGASKPAQPYGDEGKALAQKLVEAEDLKITVEIEDVDPYGRIVGWVRLESKKTTLNETLLDAGYAWWYERYYPTRSDLGARQEKAKAAKRGLWADPKPIPPWEYRRGQRGGKPSKDAV
jgi:endonuclease YncB( thermonuclease family)